MADVKFLLNSAWTAESELPQGYTWDVNAFADINVALSKASLGDNLTIENWGDTYTLGQFDAYALSSLTLNGPYAGKAIAGGTVIFDKNGSFSGTNWTVGIPAVVDPETPAVLGHLIIKGASFTASSGIVAATEVCSVDLIITGDITAENPLFNAKPDASIPLNVNVSVAAGVSLEDTMLLDTIYNLTESSGAVSSNNANIVYNLSADLKNAGYGILKTYDGIFLTKDYAYDFSSIVQSSEWTGKAKGDKVIYNGKEYTFGINAFATAQEAWATAKINAGIDSTVAADKLNVLLLDSEYVLPNPGNSAFNTAYYGNYAINGDKHVTIYSSGWDGYALGGNGEETGVSASLSNVTIGENIEVHAHGRSRFGGTINVYGTLLSDNLAKEKGISGEAFVYWGAQTQFCVNVYSTGTFGQGKSAYVSGTVGGQINVYGNGSSFRKDGQFVATKDSTVGAFSAWTALKFQAKADTKDSGTLRIVDYGYADIWNSTGFGTTQANHDKGFADAQLIMDNGKALFHKQFYFGYETDKKDGYATANISGNSYLFAEEFYASATGIWNQTYSAAVEYGKSFTLADSATYNVALDGMDSKSGKAAYAFVANLSGKTSDSLSSVNFTIEGKTATEAQKAATGYTFVTTESSLYAYAETNSYKDLAIGAAFGAEAVKKGDLVAIVDGTAYVAGINGYATAAEALQVSAVGATLTNVDETAAAVKDLNAGDGLTLKGAYTLTNLVGNLIVGNGGAVSIAKGSTISGSVTVLGGGSFTAADGVTGTASYAIVLDSNTDRNVGILNVKLTEATTITVSCADGYTASGMYKLSEAMGYTATSGAVGVNGNFYNYQLSDALVSQGYGIVKTCNGFFLTKDTYDFSVIVANEAWSTGYAIGDAVEYDGKTYTFGYNAFASFTEAIATAKYNYDPEKQIEVIAASDYTITAASNGSFNVAYYANLKVSGAVGGTTTFNVFGIDGWSNLPGTDVTGQRGQNVVIGANVTINAGGRQRYVGNYDLYGKIIGVEGYSTESFIRGGGADYDFQLTIHSGAYFEAARWQDFGGYILVKGDGEAIPGTMQLNVKDGSYGNGWKVTTYFDKANAGTIEVTDKGYARFTTAIYLGSSFNVGGTYVVPAIKVNDSKFEMAALGDTVKNNGYLYVGYTSATASENTYGVVSVTGDSDFVVTGISVSNYGKMSIGYNSTVTYRDSYFTETKFAKGSFTILAGDAGAGTKDGDVSIDFTGLNSETGKTFYAIIDGTRATGTNEGFDKIYYTIDGATKTAEEVKAATGYTIVNDGKSVYAVQDAALADMVVSDKWAAGYSMGDKITVNGVDYYYGINAFGSMQTALNAAGDASQNLEKQVNLTVVDAATQSGFLAFAKHGYNVKLSGYSETGADVTVTCDFYGQYDGDDLYECHYGTLVLDSSLAYFKSKNNFGLGGDIQVHTKVYAGEVYALDGVDAEHPSIITVYPDGDFITGGYFNNTEKAWDKAVVNFIGVGNGAGFATTSNFHVSIPWDAEIIRTMNIVAKDYGTVSLNGDSVKLGGSTYDSTITLDNGKFTSDGNLSLGAKTVVKMTGFSVISVKSLTLGEGQTISSTYTSAILYTKSIGGTGSISVAVDGLSKDSERALYVLVSGGDREGVAFDNISFTKDGKAISAAQIKTDTGYEVKTDGNIIYLYDDDKTGTQLAVNDAWAGTEPGTTVIMEGTPYVYGTTAFDKVEVSTTAGVNKQIAENATKGKATSVVLSSSDKAANSFKIAGGATVNISGSEAGLNTLSHADNIYNKQDSKGNVTSTGFVANLTGVHNFTYVYANNNSTVNLNAGTFTLNGFNVHGSGNMTVNSGVTATATMNLDVVGNLVVSGNVAATGDAKVNVYAGYLTSKLTAQSGHLVILEGGSFDAGAETMKIGDQLTDIKYNAVAGQEDVTTATVDVNGGKLTAASLQLGVAKAGILNVTEKGSAIISGDLVAGEVEGNQINITTGGSLAVGGLLTAGNTNVNIEDGSLKLAQSGSVGEFRLNGTSVATINSALTVGGNFYVSDKSTLNARTVVVSNADSTANIDGTINVKDDFAIASQDAIITGSIVGSGNEGYYFMTGASSNLVLTETASISGLGLNLSGRTVAQGALSFTEGILNSDAYLYVNANNGVTYTTSFLTKGGSHFIVDMSNFVSKGALTYIVDGRTATGGFDGDITYDFGTSYASYEDWSAATGSRIVRDAKSVYVVEGSKNDSIALNSAYGEMPLYSAVQVGATTYYVGIDAFASIDAAVEAGAGTKKYVISQMNYGDVFASWASVAYSVTGNIEEGAYIEAGSISTLTGCAMTLKSLTLTDAGEQITEINKLTIKNDEEVAKILIAADDALVVNSLVIASNTDLSNVEGTLKIAGKLTLNAGVDLKVNAAMLAALSAYKMSLGDGSTITVTEQISDADVERYDKVFKGHVVYTAQPGATYPTTIDVAGIGSDANELAKLANLTEDTIVSGDTEAASNSLVLESNTYKDLSHVNYVMRGSSKNTVTFGTSDIQFGSIANASAITLNAANAKKGIVAATAKVGALATGTGKTTITLNNGTELIAESLSNGSLGGSNVVSMKDGAKATFGAATDLGSISMGKNSEITIGSLTAVVDDDSESAVISTVGNFSLKTSAGSKVSINNCVAVVDGTKGTFSFGADNNVFIAGFNTSAALSVSVANSSKGAANATFTVGDIYTSAKATMTFGNNVTVTMGDFKAVSESATLTLKLGTDSAITAGNITGLGSLTFSSPKDATAPKLASTIGNIEGASANTTITLGKRDIVTAGDIDLGAGKNTMTVNWGAELYANSLQNVTTFKIDKTAIAEITGYITGGAGQTLAITVGDGASLKAFSIVENDLGSKASITVGKEEAKAIFTGDLMKITKISTGANSTFVACNLSGTTGKDSYTFGNDASINLKRFFTDAGDDTIKFGDRNTIYATDLDFGDGTKDTLQIGKDTELWLTGDVDGLNIVKLGANDKIYASDDAIDAIQTAGTAKGSKIDASVKFISLGTAEQAALFTTLELENADNKVDSEAKYGDGYEGWLSNKSDVQDLNDAFQLLGSAWTSGDTKLTENWVVEAEEGVKVWLWELDPNYGGWKRIGQQTETVSLNQIDISATATAVMVNVECTEAANGVYSYKVVQIA